MPFEKSLRFWKQLSDFLIDGTLIEDKISDMNFNN